RPIAAIVKQVAASFTTNSEEIEPAVVVVINERRVRGAVGKDDSRALRAVTHESALHSIQVRHRLAERRRPRGDEQLVRSITINVSDCNGSDNAIQRRRASDSAPRFGTGDTC